MFAVGLGVAFDHTLVALVGHIFAYPVLVVGAKYALPVSSVLSIQLHHSMKRSSRTSEEVEDD